MDRGEERESLDDADRMVRAVLKDKEDDLRRVNCMETKNEVQMDSKWDANSRLLHKELREK